jgi:NAD(P)-dependent dehydrogenase (short-subunit alcohol dehydrogenase family)
MDGRVAIVTGAGSGIGRAAALAFAAAGAKVVVADVKEEGAEETVARVQAAGGEALVVRTDVSREDEVRALVEAAVRVYGRLDYAHNNAAIIGPTQTDVIDVGRDDWDRVLAVNLTGVYLCMKYEIPAMLATGGGAIVNTSSSVGLIGDRGTLAYVASKHGVIGATRVAALEYATRGIRVNSICPGVTRTEMIEEIIGGDPEVERMLAAREPVGRLGRPEEIAAAVVWLCSDAASFVTGHALSVDGGQVVAP